MAPAESLRKHHRDSIRYVMHGATWIVLQLK